MMQAFESKLLKKMGFVILPPAPLARSGPPSPSFMLDTKSMPLSPSPCIPFNSFRFLDSFGATAFSLTLVSAHRQSDGALESSYIISFDVIIKYTPLLSSPLPLLPFRPAPALAETHFRIPTPRLN